MSKKQLYSYCHYVENYENTEALERTSTAEENPIYIYIYTRALNPSVTQCLSAEWRVTTLFGKHRHIKPRGNSLSAIRYEPHLKTSQSIAANCLRRIACFSYKKTKDNRTWVADQEPVNMKRLEP